MVSFSPLLLEGVPETVREHGGIGGGFVTKKHIYIYSLVDFDADEVRDPRFHQGDYQYYVWTKDGKYVGKSNLSQEIDMIITTQAKSGYYHRQSKILYIRETGGINVGQEVKQNTYTLFAFQQE